MEAGAQSQADASSARGATTRGAALVDAWRGAEAASSCQMEPTAHSCLDPWAEAKASGDWLAAVQKETEAVMRNSRWCKDFVSKAEFGQVVEAVKSMESHVFERLAEHAVGEAKERRAVEAARGSDEHWRGYQRITPKEKRGSWGGQRVR